MKFPCDKAVPGSKNRCSSSIASPVVERPSRMQHLYSISNPTRHLQGWLGWSQSYDCVEELTSRFSSKDALVVVKTKMLSPDVRLSDQYSCLGDQRLVELPTEISRRLLSSSWQQPSICRYEVLDEGR